MVDSLPAYQKLLTDREISSELETQDVQRLKTDKLMGDLSSVLALATENLQGINAAFTSAPDFKALSVVEFKVRSNPQARIQRQELCKILCLLCNVLGSSEKLYTAAYCSATLQYFSDPTSEFYDVVLNPLKEICESAETEQKFRPAYQELSISLSHSIRTQTSIILYVRNAVKDLERAGEAAPFIKLTKDALTFFANLVDKQMKLVREVNPLRTSAIVVSIAAHLGIDDLALLVFGYLGDTVTSTAQLSTALSRYSAFSQQELQDVARGFEEVSPSSSAPRSSVT